MTDRIIADTFIALQIDTDGQEPPTLAPDPKHYAFRLEDPDGAPLFALRRDGTYAGANDPEDALQQIAAALCDWNLESKVVTAFGGVHTALLARQGEPSPYGDVEADERYALRVRDGDHQVVFSLEPDGTYEGADDAEAALQAIAEALTYLWR